MQIRLAQNGCLTLLVSDEELAALGVSFDELDGNSPRTRRAVGALLQKAREHVGPLPQGGLQIEALPLDGGCLLLVSPEQGRFCEASSPTVCFVADEDALLQIAAAWPKGPHPFGESSSLYRAASGYWLILYGGSLPPAVRECADLFLKGAEAAAAAAEHATPLFIGDALPRLRGAG